MSQQQQNATAKDAVALLTSDHDKVKKLFREFEKCDASHQGLKHDLAQQICMDLTIHAQIEEEIFYPAFKESIRSQKDEHLYYEALEEHHVVDLVMPEIKSTDSDSEEFAAKAKVLKDLIEHHAEEEEKQMFPKAKKLFGSAELRDLGEQLQQRKDEMMGDTNMARRRRVA